VKPGSEEYMNSEKYEIRARNYEAPGNLNRMMGVLNAIRRENKPLQRADNLSFLLSENEKIIFYRKAGRAPDERPSAGGPRNDDLLIAVNLDPFMPHSSMVHVPIAEMGIHPDEPYVVHDLLTGARYVWRGSRNYVFLDPSHLPGHLLRVEREA
jgi:starch synthase (maltosyl-transferring)